MALPERGEVWWVDLGIAGKTRPVAVVSIPFGDSDYALMSVIPHTTTARGSEFEVELTIRGLKLGVFNVQGLLAVPPSRFVRHISDLDRRQMEQLETVLSRWLGLRSE
jgi:mRNA interferase MazF